MRTNIVIDPDLLDAAMKAGPYKTKKDAVEAGLKLLARQAAYREILKWEGKLKWEGNEDTDWTVPQPHSAPPTGTVAPVREPALTLQEASAPYAGASESLKDRPLLAQKARRDRR